MNTKKYVTLTKTLVSVTQNDFAKLYQHVIDNYVRFVGDAVSQHHFINDIPVALWELGFELSTISLKLRQGYLLPSGEYIENSHREQEAWTYAVFTSALFQYLYEIPCQLLGIGHETNNSVLAVGFAKALMPIEGFQWIYSNKNLFSHWIESLCNSEAENIITEIIKKAETFLPYTRRVSIDNKPNQKNMSVSQNVEANDTLKELPKSRGEKNLNADDFFKWLIAELRNNNLSINQRNSVVHRVSEGIFIVMPETVKKFIDTQFDDSEIEKKACAKKAYQLSNAIKHHEALIRNTPTSKTFLYYWGTWNTRETVSGVVVPWDFIYDENNKPTINPELHFDPINN